ncbi:phytanoyl-CoA dioxygenase family protein [Catellatospora coxensis]
MAELQDSSPLIDTPSLLAQRAHEEGCLLLRGLIPAATVADARAGLLDTASRHGLLGKDAASVAEAQSDRWFDYYADLTGCQDLYALAWARPLQQTMRAVIADNAIVQPCGIFRIVSDRIRTEPKPPHQDARYVGTAADIWTAWIACARCDGDTGGIAVMPQSHRDGMLDVHRVGNKNEVVVPEHLRWHGAVLEPGDVIIFSSYTIHRSVPGRRPAAVRLSADFRFQPADQPMRPEACQPHLRLRDWEGIYAAWDATRAPGRYYWRNPDLRLGVR